VTADTEPGTPTIQIAEATEVTEELVEAFVRLIPQLSTSSPPTPRGELEEIVGSPATVLFVARDIGGRIVGAMICIGLISSISAMMWIGPRVMMTMGEDIPALRVFARKSTQGAPAYAILFQLAVASLMLFTRSFEAVLDFIQFALLFCSFFTVLGVIKLRITQPDTPRPYRAWGYPITPVVFLLVTAFMMYYLLTERPLQSVLGALIMISGLLIYAVFRRRDDRATSSPGRE